MNFQSVAEYLASAGADVEALDGHGYTALLMAVVNGHDEVVRYMGFAHFLEVIDRKMIFCLMLIGFL